jgi:hypothetical protein
MHEGKVVTSGFAYQSLSTLAGKLGQNLNQEQGLRDLATAVKVENGRVKLDRFKSRLGDLGDLVLDGSYGFTGDLDYTGTLLLTEKQSRALLTRGGLTGQLAEALVTESGGRLSLPLTLAGTMAKPRLQVDYARLTQMITDQAKDNLQEQLKGELEGKLKGLFKK